MHQKCESICMEYTRKIVIVIFQNLAASRPFSPEFGCLPSYSLQKVRRICDWVKWIYIQISAWLSYYLFALIHKILWISKYTSILYFCDFMGLNSIIVSEQIFSSTWWNKFIPLQCVMSGKRMDLQVLCTTDYY